MLLTVLVLCTAQETFSNILSNHFFSDVSPQGEIEFNGAFVDIREHSFQINMDTVAHII